MRRSLCVLIWLVVLAGLLIASCPTFALAQEGADDEPFLPGLVAEYQDVKGRTATRLDHQLAFHWGASAPDPRLAAGEFRATWRGQLLVSTRGEYRFFVFGTGELELKIAGRAVIKRQTLRKGWRESASLRLVPDNHSLELSFRRTEKDAHLMVLWSGPDFGMEPIPSRTLFHPREKPVGGDFERGRLLARVLRCGRCHGEDQPSLAPALDGLSGTLSRGWLVRWLAAGEHDPTEHKGGEVPLRTSPRRMPAFSLSQVQAEAVADWLLAPQAGEHSAPPPPGRGQPRKKSPKPDAHSGERLFVTLGCLACHGWRDLGSGGWLGGGDLTHIADKRPPDFFGGWLADPARLNRDHRMPVFDLADEERASLALFLAAQKTDGSKPDFNAPKSADRRAEGGKLIEQFRCGACHRLCEGTAVTPRLGSRLNERSDWDNACLDAPDPAKHRPGYRLAKSEARVVRLYYSSSRQDQVDGRLVLAEQNCLACHAREGTREAVPLLPPLLADKLMAVVKRYPDLAPFVPALTPPALNSVGDKLTDSALVEAIARRTAPHRPYLRVRMPRFPLADGDLQTLVQELISTDRIPPRDSRPMPPVDRSRQDRYALAGGRLISSDGFGCTSCHQVGSVLPSSAPLNARGPDLSLLDRRIRRPWFDRWVRNPARIVPRMEMPSVQIPVSGVLDGKLDEQLAAVWQVLTLPGFEPPLPNPIRTLRQTGNSPEAEAVVLTDVIQYQGEPRIKPFLVGLANRHNVLLDLEAGGLTAWTVGDTARQRTKGKAWFWEVAGTTVLDTGIKQPDLSLVTAAELFPQVLDQFVTEADDWRTEGSALVLNYRLKFSAPATMLLHVRRKLGPLATGSAGSESGFAQVLSVGPVPAGGRVRLRVLSAEAAAKATRSEDGRSIRLGDRYSSRISLMEPADAKFSEDRTGVLLAPDAKGAVRVVLHYQSEVPIDRFPEMPSPPTVARKGEPVEIAPGFTGERLPLSAEIMPTGLAWRPDGRLVFCSLKGQVFEAVDSDHDGTENRLRILADGLAAPYGVHAGSNHVDVSAKYAVLRLTDVSKSGRRVEAIASGWGYSTDYHDWAVGLPQNERGEYFLGIPCQQDKRSPIAARFHGAVLRLTPRTPTTGDPRRFAISPLSTGHRFPMGLALDRAGELFATDNQGNYKPFNELNHVRPGAYFGFVNSLDRGKPAPATTPPAIDIPHPWTRSVNGICFLYTPKEVRTKLGRGAFGRLEGHLIGCEYDTRRLIRMTLQRVGDTFQGAAYPLSIPPQDPQRGFLGPLVCAVSPRGELYVGSIRDSGWGAGNNVGEIVRVQIHPDKLPCGIAEVRATHDGFDIDFFRPIDGALARQIESYAIQSYRREATPAYGGPDRDRRTEKVAGVAVAADGCRVTLKLAEMRPGCVYELRLKNLALGSGEFHPAEAHYTLRVVPR